MPNKDERLEESMTGPVDEAVNEAAEKGYVGVKVDPLPNEAHTFQGQLKSPERTAHRAPDAPAEGKK